MFCGWLSGKYIWWVNYFVKYILSEVWAQNVSGLSKLLNADESGWKISSIFKTKGDYEKNIQISSIVQDEVLPSDFIK